MFILQFPPWDPVDLYAIIQEIRSTQPTDIFETSLASLKPSPQHQGQEHPGEASLIPATEPHRYTGRMGAPIATSTISRHNFLSFKGKKWRFVPQSQM